MATVTNASGLIRSLSDQITIDYPEVQRNNNLSDECLLVVHGPRKNPLCGNPELKEPDFSDNISTDELLDRMSKISQMTEKTSLSNQMLRIQNYNRAYERLAEDYASCTERTWALINDWGSKTDAMNAAKILAGKLPRNSNEYQHYVTKQLTPLTEAAENANTALMKGVYEAEKLKDSASRRQYEHIERRFTQEHDNHLNLAFLVSLVMVIFDKVKIDQMMADIKLKDLISDTVVAHTAKCAKEFDKKIEEAKEKEKEKSLFGKIFGTIIAVVAVVLAVATGGLFALVLSVIFLADQLLANITGESLIGKLLSPVIEPVMNAISAAAEKVADFLVENTPQLRGLSESVKKRIKEDMKAVLTAVIVVLVSIAAIFILRAKAVTKLMPDMVKKLVTFRPEWMKTLQGGVSQALGEKFLLWFNYITLTAGGAAAKTAPSYYDFEIAGVNLDAAYIKKELLKDNSLMELSGSMLNNFIRAFTQRSENLKHLTQEIITILNNSKQNMRAISRYKSTSRA